MKKPFVVILLVALGLLSVPTPARAADPSTRPVSPPEMVLIPGGSFKMGESDGFPFEAPVHEITLKPFWMDQHEVTVGQFEKFVAATSYKTDAEKFGWSGVFDVDKGEWTKVDGADF